MFCCGTCTKFTSRSPRKISPLIAGIVGLFVAGAFGLALCLEARVLRAQPPAKKVRLDEEEEPEKSKVPAKINDVNPKDPPSSSRPPLPQGNFNIAHEAARAKNPEVKEFLRRLAVPYDKLISAKTEINIGLLPERQLPDGKITYLELNMQLNGGKEKDLLPGQGFSLLPYEEIVLESVNQFAKKNIEAFNHDDQLELCVQVLQATRRFHAFALDQKKRVGKDWERVDEKLRKRTIQFRREQLKAGIAAKDWQRADELSLELSNYSDNPDAKKDVYRYMLLKEILALNPNEEEDYYKVRNALNLFENLAGGRGDDLALAARQKLTNRAQRHVDNAANHVKNHENSEAFRALKAAEALDPELPGIGQVRLTLRGKSLFVGVPRLPDYLSPARARTDAERWGVELLFESLLQAVPDPELGRRYRPVLAESMPEMSQLAREFSLARHIYWAGGDGNREIDAGDVFDTLELLRQQSHLPCAEGLDVLDADKLRIVDRFRMKLSFNRGVLEPLSKMTFKILPARYLKLHTKEVDDDQFGRNPFGSGPYRYKGRETAGAGRETAVFEANPQYAKRPGKLGLPNIPEIRFVVPRPSGAGDDIRGEQLHIVLDVPAGELRGYMNDPQSAGLVKASKMLLNRRIWALAINHRHQALQNVSLRRGLCAAIDREKILNTETFRPGGNKSYHSALTGPFPLHSWATPEKARKPEASLFNRDLASGLFAEAASRERIRLKLKFPQGDDQAVQACEKIQQQIEEASKKTPAEEPGVKIDLEPVAAEFFYRDLEQKQDFDLAYVPLDFKDDLYSLSGLLDPSAAGQGGRNYMGYLAPNSNPQPDDSDLRNSLEQIRSHRDFRDRVREETWKVHTKFLNRMPFVPLWQLDRFIIVHRDLQLFFDNPNQEVPAERIDPSTVFIGVENWRWK